MDPQLAAEVERLYAHYARTLDGGDPEGWAGCFTTDGSFQPSSGGVVEGADELRRFAAERQAEWRDQGMTVKHWSNQLLVDELDGGERLRASCYGMVVSVRAGEPPSVLVSSTFHDELVRVDGHWLFSKRASIPDGR